jgi:hypothetical protein
MRHITTTTVKPRRVTIAPDIISLITANPRTGPLLQVLRYMYCRAKPQRCERADSRLRIAFASPISCQRLASLIGRLPSIPE